jgi:hypothetical protein
MDVSAGRLCLFPLAPINTYSLNTTNYPVVTYSALSPLTIDAFIGWGWAIRGQLWDAFLQTAATPLDAMGSFLDTDATGEPVTLQAIAWHSDFFSTLQLIFGAPVGTPAASGVLGNVAF